MSRNAQPASVYLLHYTLTQRKKVCIIHTAHTYTSTESLENNVYVLYSSSFSYFLLKKRMSRSIGRGKT